VEDTGVGITPEQLERIFQPFEQVGETGKRAEGTGLGLAISRQIVELMGGQLQVESEVGRGSTFRFEVALPLTEAAAKEEPAPLRNIVGYEGARRKVLVVDDRQYNRLLLVDMLEPLGFAVSTANDGQQAVEVALELQPDAIVMDNVMPVKTGLEAVREIRQQPELKDVFIIAASASVLEADQEKSLAAGCDAFLPKPISWPSLAALLEEHLKLEWTYGQEQGSTGAGESAPPPPLTPAPLAPPPEEELAILHDLALRGDMRGIREQAAHIETLGEQYAPFARKLHELAKSFEEGQIRTLIEQYVEKG
jgi:CheY-like chemotaxis protein